MSDKKLSAADIAENRKLWAAALRSGKYTQTRNRSLREGDALCCLGVCLVAAVGRWPALDRSISQHDYDDVRAAVGISSFDLGKFWVANDDKGKTFAEIADMVDALPAPEEVPHD